MFETPQGNARANAMENSIYMEASIKTFFCKVWTLSAT